MTEIYIPALPLPAMRRTLGFTAGFLVVTVAVVLDWTARLDLAVGAAVAGARSRILSDIALNVTALAGDPVVVLVMVIAGLYVYVAGRRDLLPAVVGAPLGAFVSSALIKLLVHHPRPEGAIIALPQTFTYPSGHATEAIALWVTYAFVVTRNETRPAVRQVLLGAAVTIALLIAWSRVYLGVHYLSDVVGGLLLGAAWAFALGPLPTKLNA
jgi:undecaprenyl-diphosphatase